MLGFYWGDSNEVDIHWMSGWILQGWGSKWVPKISTNVLNVHAFKVGATHQNIVVFLLQTYYLVQNQGRRQGGGWGGCSPHHRKKRRERGERQRRKRKEESKEKESWTNHSKNMFSWASSDPQTPDGPQTPNRNGVGISRLESALPFVKSSLRQCLVWVWVW